MSTFSYQMRRRSTGIVTESGERFSVDECRKAFHYERFTVNSLLRALRRGVEYMNRFYAAVRDEASGVISFVAKDFVATGTSSGVAHRKTTCILRTVETSAAMHGEQSEVIVNALDLRCLASLVTRDGAVSAAPLVDFAAHMKARSVMAIWLESGALRRCYARRRFQPLPPRGIGRLHPYIDDRFRDATSNADNDDELPTYRFNQRDYEDIACLGGYRLVALAHLYHCYNVFVSRDDTIWREWLGFYAHFAQMPFENCAQILAVLCARGSGKSVSVEWIAACMADEHVQTSATAHQCLGQFNAPLQHKTFVFLDEYHGPSLSTECSRSLNLLATADRISIQAKHRNPVECRNFSHVVVASDQADALGGGGGGGSGGGSSRRGEVANTNGAGQRQRRPLICCTDASLLDFDTRAREAAYFGLLMERLGRSADKFGHCTIANLYYSIDLTQLPFNASANAKDTKAREEQAVKAMSTVQLFVKRILDGSIVAPRQQQDASCTVQAPAPFWTDIAGSDDKTFTRAVSVDDFFATYRAEMLSEGKMTDLTRDDFCKEMAKYLPERIDTTHKKAAKADLAQRDDVVVISRATTEVVRGGQSERPRMHRWPKWSVCCKAFKMATGVGFEPWRAADDNDEDADIVQSTSSVGTISASASTTIASASSASASTSTSLGGSAADSKEGADNVKDAATAYGCFCDDVLLLAKPMRADPVLFKPNTQCRQLCCYFNVRVIESDGWVQDQYLGRALDTGLAMARSNVAAFEAACASARCSDDNDDSILPRLDDYVPEQSYELCSVPPLERVPPAIRHCAQDFANRHGVDVALLLLPDGVWATVQTETAQTATAQHHQRNGGLCAALTQATCNRRLSRLSIARDASCAPLARAGVARGDSIAATSSCSAAREQMARIEVRMEPALRIGEEYMRPLDIVLRRRTRASGDKGPVVCVALWGRLGRDCNGSGCFVKPLVRYKDLVFNHY
jgi:hypothetical protein